MAKVHFVKKAQKDYPDEGIKKGESYFHWKPKIGGRGSRVRRSKTRPKASQLTNSEFLSNVYALQEEIGDAKPENFEDLEGLVEDWKNRVEEIRDETQEKFDNMPQSLQGSSTGELLEQRVQAMEDWHNELDNIDLDESDFKDLEGEKLEEALAEKMAEITDISVDV